MVEIANVVYFQIVKSSTVMGEEIQNKILGLIVKIMVQNAALVTSLEKIVNTFLN